MITMYHYVGGTHRSWSFSARTLTAKGPLQMLHVYLFLINALLHVWLLVAASAQYLKKQQQHFFLLIVAQLRNTKPTDDRTTSQYAAHMLGARAKSVPFYS